MEIKRQERLAKSEKKTKELNKKLEVMKAAKDGKGFIAAADDMALWVIGEGSGAPRPRTSRQSMPAHADALTL